MLWQDDNPTRRQERAARRFAARHRRQRVIAIARAKGACLRDGWWKMRDMLSRIMGREYESRRLPDWPTPGKQTKVRTHRRERRAAKTLTMAELQAQRERRHGK